MHRAVRLTTTTVLPVLLAGWVSHGCAPAPHAPSADAAARPPGEAAPRPIPPGAFRFDPALFSPKKPPRPGDWMASHREEFQGFDAYVRADPSHATPERRVIVLQPLGHFSEDEAKMLESLGAYLKVFFQTDTRTAAPLSLPQAGMRVGDRERPAQFRTDIILDQVLAPGLPADAICYLGITMADLFPDPAWNFVFGMASLQRRVGVFSLARYGPAFNGEADTPARRQSTLRRALKVMAHETGHMFSLPHCTFYECLMNGSNSLGELDRNPPWLCPLCLRKLHWNARFDIRKRYDDLRAFFERHDLADERRWVEQRIAQL